MKKHKYPIGAICYINCRRKGLTKVLITNHLGHDENGQPLYELDKEIYHDKDGTEKFGKEKEYVEEYDTGMCWEPAYWIYPAQECQLGQNVGDIITSLTANLMFLGDTEFAITQADIDRLK